MAYLLNSKISMSDLRKLRERKLCCFMCKVWVICNFFVWLVSSNGKGKKGGLLC